MSVDAVDHTTLGGAGLARSLPLDREDGLVTDLTPNSQRLGPYRRAVTLP